MNFEKKPTIHIGQTRFPIVKHISEEILGWKAISEGVDWDVMWADTPQRLSGLKPYQKVNHFPGMQTISRKNTLASNLCRLRRQFPSEYDFYPRTWIVSSDFADLKMQMQANKHRFMIVKPEASSQGRGIFLTNKPEEIEPGCIVQDYIMNPFLIDGLKFDLRIYVLVTGCAPLRIFVHEEGLTRFATRPYQRPNASNCRDRCVHLTNYAVNRLNPNFVYNSNDLEDDIGHKRSLSQTFKHLEKLNFDVKTLQDKIHAIIIKTISCAQPLLSHSYYSSQPYDFSNSMCFEVLGFDILVDEELNPWLLEVNSSPSFSVHSPLDQRVKTRVIKDALVLMNILPENKMNYINHAKAISHQRILGNFAKESKNIIKQRARTQLLKRDIWEANNSSGYTKIYQQKRHDRFIKAANSIWQEWTNGKAKKKPEIPKVQPKRRVKIFAYKRRDSSVKKVHKSEEPKIIRKAVSDAVFKRLTEPIIKRYKSHTHSIIVPIIYSIEEPKPNIEKNKLLRSMSDAFQVSSNIFYKNDCSRALESKHFSNKIL